MRSIGACRAQMTLAIDADARTTTPELMHFTLNRSVDLLSNSAVALPIPEPAPEMMATLRMVNIQRQIRRLLGNPGELVLNATV